MAASYRESYTVSAPQMDDYEAKELPSYEAQEDKVNQTYDAKQESSLAALESAYNQNMMDANAALEKIPGAYRPQRNSAEAEYEKQRKAFAEYAANSGVNSGAGSQAQLAYSNQLQNELNDIGVAQANATADAQLQISKLKQGYQDSVAQAIKENDYERAAALLGEYQKAAQSVVDVAQAQADEYYRAYQANLANRQYSAEWERTADAEAYDRARQQAETLAAYGDFSGYQALGYTPEQIAQMEAYWALLNGGGYGGGSGGGYSRSGGSYSGGGGGSWTSSGLVDSVKRDSIKSKLSKSRSSGGSSGGIDMTPGTMKNLDNILVRSGSGTGKKTTGGGGGTRYNAAR